MTAFRLRFAGGRVTGGGRDVVGRFVFGGEYDEATGRVTLVKQYVGRHRVLYVGRPDGEGCIQGTWSIGPEWTGPFAIRPVVAPPAEDAPIEEIG
jgi:hypothetical protein